MDYSVEDNKKRIKKYKSKTPKVKNKIGLLIFRAVVTASLVAMFAGGGAVLGAYLAVINDTPTDFERFVIEPSKYSTVIVDKDGNETGGFMGTENRVSASFEDVPQDFKNAIIAIEDERFYSHNGIDIRSIVRSVRETLMNNNLQGASTITQQLIKMNITKVTRNTIESKLKEQYIAIKYEEFLTEKLGGKKAAKDYILSVYINTIPMHHNVSGIQTAANFYFGKDASQLTLSESAVLAGITNRPGKYAPDINPEYNAERRELILDKMLELDFITESEYRTAMSDDVYARVSAYSLASDDAPSFHTFYEDQIFESLLSDLMDMGYDEYSATNLIYDGGLTIVSAQNKDIQKIVDAAYLDDANFPAKDFELDVLYKATIQNTVTGQIRNIEEKKTVKTEDLIEEFIETAKLRSLGANEVILSDRSVITPQPQSAFAVIDYHTGQVKAISGGRGDKTNNRAFNRATKATRSPGSTFKVLASFAPAIDMGLITPASVIDDVPFLDGKYAPVNWYKTGFRGYSDIRAGITNSMNIVAAKNMKNTGIDNCFEYLLNFGFTTLVDETNEYGQTDRVLPAALGGLTNGVTQVELAAAYGTIANEGYYNKPVFYTQVFDHDGDLLIDNILEPKQVLRQTSAYLLTNMMQGVLTDPGATGGRARFKDVKMPIAGKTGTSSDTNDLVFVGYTPYYAASVWLGFDIQKPIEHASGDHITLWSKIMEEVHRDLPYRDFERPDGIVSEQVCRYSGKLPVMGLCDSDPRGSAVKTEIFAADTVPSESCDIHASVTMDTSTSMRAGLYCPPEVTETVIGILRLDPETAGKANDSIYEVNPYAQECSFHDISNSFVIPDGIFPPGDGPSDLDIFSPEYTPETDVYPGNGPPDDTSGETETGGGVSDLPVPPPQPDFPPVPEYQLPSNYYR